MRLTMPGVLLPLICSQSFGKNSLLIFPTLRVHIKENNNSRHGKFYRFLFPFSSKFSRPKLRPICSLYLLMLFETRTWHKYCAWVTCAQICLTFERQEKWVLAFAAINYGFVWVTTKKKGRVLVWHARNHFTIINQLWELAFSSLGE